MKEKLHIITAINYIENNLSDELDINKISHLSFASPVQLYRDFYNITGHSVKEYIRRRRLSNALALVKHSELNLVDIAYECGYSSQQVFCKSVKAAIKQTPLEYKNSDEYYYFPPYSSEAERQIAVATENIPGTVCVKFYHSRLRGIENNAVYILLEIIPNNNGVRIFGRNGKQDGSSFCYELFVSGVDITVFNDSEFSDVQTIPPFFATIATTVSRNTDEGISEAWDYLYIDWLKSSMFEQSDKPYFEEYIIKNRKISKLKLYLPIQKRNDYTKIALESIDTLTFLISQKYGYNAEDEASRAVMDFVSSHYPYLLESTSEFYVSKGQTSCTCGIRLTDGLYLPETGKLEILKRDGLYAVLYGDCCGNYAVYEKMLTSWVRDNGFERDDTPIFAVYEATDGFDNAKLKLYCNIRKQKKMVRTDNTNKNPSDKMGHIK